MATPLQTVKSRFNSKEALVDALMPMLDRAEGEDDAAFRDRLLRVSNKKLLRLHARAETLRDTFGNREALVDQVVKLKMDGRLDPDLRRKAQGLSTGRLLSMHAGLSRR